jgi:hypothetical protein
VVQIGYQKVSVEIHELMLFSIYIDLVYEDRLLEIKSKNNFQITNWDMQN